MGVRNDSPGFISREDNVVHIFDVRVDLLAVREWAWQAFRSEDPWMPRPSEPSMNYYPVSTAAAVCDLGRRVVTMETATA
ncbi:MAG: hypothetical protein M3460_23415 [Actinomycetota bacterium]|nr:hypothetical protein [Actinomycetota bacterium]